MNKNDPNLFSIRPAVESDIDDIERLVMENFPHLIQAMMGNKPDEIKHQILVGLRKSRVDPIANVFVAVNDADVPVGIIAYDTQTTTTGFQKDRLTVLKPLGFMGVIRFLLTVRFTLVNYMPPPQNVYVRTLAIDKAYRRQGLGNRLVDYAEQTAKAEGNQKATCFVASNNTSALTLTQRIGYVPMSRRKTFWRGRLLGEPGIIYLEKQL